MNLGEIKENAIKLMDEYSNNANLTDDEDIRLKLNSLINMAQIFISTIKKIPKTYEIVQNNPINQIDGEIDAIHTHSNEDIVFKAKGKAYHFMVNDIATIIISQEGMEDIIINHDTGTDELIRYKGITTGTGDITIRFTGNYYYSIKNVAIFDADFSSIDKIPNFEKLIEYDLPKDFREIKQIVRKTNKKQERYRDFNIRNKKIIIDARDIGEYEINYYAFPTAITNDTPDDFELDNEPDAHIAISYYAVADILKSDVSANYTAFEYKLNSIIEMLMATEQQKGSVIGFTRIIGNL